MPIPQVIREYRLSKKAVNSYEGLLINEVPLPTPKATEVLIKVHAVSLNFRDIMIYHGQYPLELKEDVLPGSDMAGEIVALGGEVHGWSVGDRVSSNFMIDHIFGNVSETIAASALGGPIDGALTEYKIIPAHALVRIPDHLSYEEMSTLPCAAVTAYNALLGLNPLKAGDVVVVQGTGGVSIFALQFAVASGATVIATSSSDKKLELAKILGAKHLINYKTTPEWHEEVLRITGGRGADHIVEVGGPSTLMKSVQCIRHGGLIDMIGHLAGPADTSAFPLAVLRKAAIFRGVVVGSRTQFEEMNRLITANEIRPIVDKVFDFDHVRNAYAYLASQQHVGKVVVRVSKD